MREQELKLEKVRKSCNTARKIAKVFKIIMIVATVMCLVAAGCLFAFRGQLNDEIKSVNEIKPGTVTIDDMDFQTGFFHYEKDINEIIANGTYAESFAEICLMGAIAVAVFAVIFALIEKIFVTIDEEESPFTEKVLKTVKKLFIGIAVIMGLEVGIGLGLFLGLFFWCLYCILDYGFALQKEIDETL